MKVNGYGQNVGLAQHRGIRFVVMLMPDMFCLHLLAMGMLAGTVTVPMVVPLVRVTMMLVRMVMFPLALGSLVAFWLFLLLVGAFPKQQALFLRVFVYLQLFYRLLTFLWGVRVLLAAVYVLCHLVVLLVAVE